MMDEAKINDIARKFADLMDADRANPSANVPTEMARISGAIREAIATLETQLAEALKYGARENAKALSYVKNPCKKHNQYWTTFSGACMACRAVNAETQLAAANEAVRVLGEYVAGIENAEPFSRVSELQAAYENNPLARASVEKVGKQ